MAGDSHPVEIGALALQGFLGVPDAARGLVIFAHGSGSGRLSPRNTHVAAALRQSGLATLLLDLLTQEEERYRANVFDIPLLASRLLLATNWVAERAETAALPIGYFGASTGAGAALTAAADDSRIAAIVSRGGRPDLAGEALERVCAPTLLIVGGRDEPVIALNRDARDRLKAESQIVIVPGATHLFEEPGTLDQVIGHAAHWFLAHLPGAAHESSAIRQ
jgi:pimeloyl-ACP methyl ester carboxylesterase